MIFAICDDNKETAACIANTLKQRYADSIETVEFCSSESLFAFITDGTVPDCIFMDIVLGDNNGIDELRKLSKYLRGVPVIFVTGYTEYCQDIFIDFSPYGLLTKPIDGNKLYYYTDKIIAACDEMSLSFIVNIGKQHIVLKNRNVLCVESDKRKLIYHTEHGDYVEYIKMDDALKKLRTGFIRCHKSFAVNFRYVKTIDKVHVVLTNGTDIHISRQYSETAKSNYINLKSQSLGI